MSQSISKKAIKIFNEFDKKNTGEIETDFLQVMVNKLFDQQISQEIMQHIEISDEPFDLT